MGTSYLRQGLLTFCLLAAGWMTACRTSTPPGPANGEVAVERKSLAPQRVDIRGSILTKRYDQGQVMLEVEAFPSPDSRYDRAFVLVTPITQLVNEYGQSISLSELQQGQNVAILLRNGGRGNRVGLGVARKLWVEER